jgi:VWFA-related protein
VDVNVVNVDVYVTDGKGARIADLTVDDFEVFEDGDPVKITNFYAVENRRRLDEGGGRTAAEAPSPSEQSSGPPLPLLEEEPLPENQRLYVILYFDNLFLRPFDRNKVMTEVVRFLWDNVTTEDQVMVVSFNRDVHVRQPFTSDLRAVATTLRDMERDTGSRVQTESERREVIRTIERARDHSEAFSHVDFYAKSVFHDVTTSLATLKDLVGSLAGLPGRKALIHVSDGLPMKAALELFELIDLIWPDNPFSGRMAANHYDSRRQFRELAARANASRVTFYTLDAKGLRSHTSLSAEYGGKGGNLANRASLAEADFLRFSNETEPLQMMALDTGGLASFNTNNFSGALDRLGVDFRSYYSLGYQSAHFSDGRYHKIQVKVKRKGAVVRHRAGFRGKTPESTVNDATYASLLYARVANPLDIVIEFEAARPSEKGRLLVPIVVKVPIGNLALIPQNDLYRAAMRVSVAVIDEEGRLSPVQQEQVPIEIPESELGVARGKYYVYASDLLMRPGEQTVAVGVRDDLSGESSYVRRSLRAGA